jgi:hypothetical protein
MYLHIYHLRVMIYSHDPPGAELASIAPDTDTKARRRASLAALRALLHA